MELPLMSGLLAVCLGAFLVAATALFVVMAVVLIRDVLRDGF